MKKIIFTLLAVTGICLAASAAPGLTVKPAAKTPVIDGEIGDTDPWESITETPAAKVFEAAGDDFAASFKMCFDNDNIYVLVSVTDDTPNVEADQTWKDDCAELFFAMDTANADAYRPGDWQIRKVRTKDAPDGVDGSANINTLKEAAGFAVAETGDGAGYIQEWKLPIAVLKESSAFDGKYFRFDIQAANNVAGDTRAGSLFWNSSANDQWSKVTNQGLAFMETTPSAIENNSSAKAKAYVSGEILHVSNVNGLVSMYDISGKLVLKANIYGKASINVASLHRGIYFIKNQQAGLISKIFIQ